jgi:hypothetical protein
LAISVTSGICPRNQSNFLIPQIWVMPSNRAWEAHGKQRDGCEGPRRAPRLARRTGLPPCARGFVDGFEPRTPLPHRVPHRDVPTRAGLSETLSAKRRLVIPVKHANLHLSGSIAPTRAPSRPKKSEAFAQFHASATAQSLFSEMAARCGTHHSVRAN